jgi:inner membrane protein
LVVAPQGYYVGYYSLLAPGPLRFELHPSEPELLADVAEAWPVQRLRWFTKGFNAVSERAGQVVLSDLRMGLEPNHYVFSFVLGQRINGTTELIPAARVAPAPYQQSDWQALAERIVGPNGLR